MFKVEIHHLGRLAKYGLECKVRKAIRILEAVVNSDEYKSRALELKMTETGGRSPKQVLDHILSGSDKFNLEEDGDLDLYLTGYFKRFSRVIGYTFHNTWKTWINRKYVRRMSIDSIAANILHEGIHNMGYTHKGRKYTSVPYTHSRLVKEVAGELRRKGKL